MKAICILAILSMSLCLTGGWKEESLNSNDMIIDRCRRVAEENFFKKNDVKENDVYIYPFAIYSQLVNGMKYKILFAAKNLKKNTIDICETDVYTGPAGSRDLTFEVLNQNVLPAENNLPINSANFGKITDAVTKYYSKKNEKLSYITTIRTNENVLYNYGVYLVEVQTQKSKNPQTLVVMEKDLRKFEVVAFIR